MAEPISAYDLARDIAREIEADPDAIVVDLDDETASLAQDRAAAIIELMIRAALKDGGIRA